MNKVIDITLLKQVLAWLFAGPGAGVLAFWVMERWIPKNLTAEAKRYVSLALAACFAMAAFVLSVLAGYQLSPATAQGWIEALFAVAFVATGLSQGIHGRVKLRRS